MISRGLYSIFPMSELSVMGLVEIAFGRQAVEIAFGGQAVAELISFALRRRSRMPFQGKLLVKRG